MSQKRKYIYIVMMFMLVPVVYGIYLYISHSKDNTNHSNLESRQKVEAAFVAVEDFSDQYEVHGTLVNQKQVDIQPDYAGVIQNIYFKSGQRVHEGDVLIELDSRVAKSELVAAEAQLKLKQMNVSRIEELFKRKIISAQNHDEAVADLRTQENQVIIFKDKVDKLCLRAPFSGVLTSNQLSVGQHVQQGQLLVKIIDNDSLKVRYLLPERYAGLLKIGQTITITTDALEHETFNAEVDYVAPEVDVANRGIEIEALINNSNHKLTGGMFVMVTHHFGEHHARMMVPEESLIPTVSGQKIFVIDGDKVKAVQVETGVHNDGKTEIINGLKPHQKIVVRGQSKLRDGSLVLIQNESQQHG